MLGLLAALITPNLENVAVDFIDRIWLEVFVVFLTGLLCFDVEIVNILSNHAYLLTHPC